MEASRLHYASRPDEGRGWQGRQAGGRCQPGGILFIDGKLGVSVTHGIHRLGQFGKHSKGEYRYLVIDATGIMPQHADSKNRINPEGLQIRPFAERGVDASKGCYFGDIDHVLRIIK